MAADNAVAVHGRGVAALTCAHLLGRSGWDVRVAGKVAHPKLHLLLNEQTVELLCFLWNDPDLLNDAHRITARLVCWADPAKADIVPSPGVVIPADELRRRLAARLDSSSASNAAWIIDGEGFEEGTFRYFGTRQAWVAQARLHDTARDDLCIMEATPAGWVFLLPRGNGEAVLQLVRLRAEDCAPSSHAITASTRFVAGSVREIGAFTGPFPAMPRLRVAPARPPRAGVPGMIAVGEAAAAFDPVSGDGVGHALRGAVLAARVLRAIVAGESAPACLAHYETTLSRAMAHHLEICRGCYSNAATAPHWRPERDRMIEAHEPA